MKAVGRECLLAFMLVLSFGVTSAFIAPASGRISIPRRRQSLASSAAAADAAAAAVVEQEVLDFAIVGGGPAGLAAAVELKKKGLNVKVYEGELRGRPNIN